MNRRISGTLALFALALQMALAFGHIHLRDFAGIPGVASAQAQVQANNDNPNGPNGTGHSDDYCPICATTHVAGTLVLPDLVVLALPVEATEATYAQICSAACRTFDHALFRARAPPLV
jgi:hypothetical protein